MALVRRRTASGLYAVETVPGLRCIGSGRHLLDEGATTRELDSTGGQWWLEVLECGRCGSVRVGRYYPRVPLVRYGGFRYIRPASYVALLADHAPSDAREIIFKAMWDDKAGPALRARVG